MKCNICGNDRCMGKYLLHPKEMIFVPRIKEENLKINKKRDFKIVNSPSSGEIFTTFKEVHVIAADDEDPETAETAKVYVEDLVEKIKRGI